MPEKILYDFFFLNLKDYSNIGVDFEINVFLLILFVALGVSFFVINTYRQNVQAIVMQLTRHECNSPESAKTIDELNLANNFIIRMALSGEGQLGKVIGRVGETVYSYEEYVKLESEGKIKRERIDFSEAKFYIRDSENAADRAKFILDNYNSSTLRTILLAVLLLALYVCLALAMPEILTIINDLLGNLAN